MKKIREQKGITLVALIVTIVVLLILAVVTMNSMESSGIISKSQSTGNKYNEAQDKKQNMLGDYLNYLNSGTKDTAAPEDVFVWESDDPSDEGYGTVIGYTSNIDNYPSLRFPDRCTKIEMTYLEKVVEDTRRIMRRYTGNIKEIELPNTVTAIGESAFSDYEFDSLKKINIPSSVTTIGDYAFQDCVALTAIFIPRSVTSIGAGAFRNCSSLATITFGGTIAEWNKISFEGIWNYGVAATYVKCTDGTVSL